MPKNGWAIKDLGQMSVNIRTDRGSLKSSQNGIKDDKMIPEIIKKLTAIKKTNKITDGYILGLEKSRGLEGSKVDTGHNQRK